MDDIISLYPKGIISKKVNKSTIDKLFEARKLLGNHWGFNLYGCFGTIKKGDNNEKD